MVLSHCWDSHCHWVASKKPLWGWPSENPSLKTSMPGIPGYARPSATRSGGATTYMDVCHIIYIYIILYNNYIITLYNHTEHGNGQSTRFRELNINIIPTFGSQKRDQLPHRGSTTRKFLPSSAVREATSLSPTGAWQKTNFSSHPMMQW